MGPLARKGKEGGREEEEKLKQRSPYAPVCWGLCLRKGEKRKRERDKGMTRAHVPQTGTALVAGADSEKDVGLRVSQAQVSGLSCG